MAVPNDRRVIHGTHVIPQETYSTTSTEVTREEGSTAGTASYTDYRLDTTIGKRFGGKGSVAITEDQGTDFWTSMASLGQEWNLFDETWNGTASTWDTGTGEVSVNDSLSVIRSGSDVIKFLYIKNLGSVDCWLSLEASGGADEPDIFIPPGAAVSMRTTSSVTAATVKVSTEASSGTTTTIEYIIAI